MTNAQRMLVIKSLKVVGIVGLAIGCLLVAFGVFQVFVGAITIGRFFKGLFDPEDAALVVWPIFAFGVVCMWVSAYLKAGESP